MVSTATQIPQIENEAKTNEASNLISIQPLPEALREACEKYTHLREYISKLRETGIGVPEYLPQLSRKMAEKTEPNLIYPVSSNGVFVHILYDRTGDRHNYIPIEPTTMLDISELMDRVEESCIRISENIPGINPDIDRQKHLLAFLEQVTTHKDIATKSPVSKLLRFGRKEESDLAGIKVTPRELEGIKYLFIRDKVRMGVLEPLITDPYIEDISCSGLGNIFIEHKIFKSLKSSIDFSDFDELDEFVVRMAERIRQPVTYKRPIADATLPDGSRVNIVYGRDVSKRGSNFSIRKFAEVPLSIFEIVDFGTINYQMLAYLSMAIANGMNIFVAGESASGKTALLNALTAFIPARAKVITIEDTPELQVPHQNWIREVVQTSKSDDAIGSVTMFDLLRAALRQRPNEIIVGEIRGKEGNIAFQAMQTGHSVMATFHAATIEKLIQRITGDPISVPKTYIDNLNIAVLMGLVRLPNGRTARRVTSVAEIVGWDSLSQTFNIAEAFRLDESTDTYQFTGYMTSYVMEFKIAPMLGIPNTQKRRIYDELDRRAMIFSKLHKEKGVTGFYEVLDVLSKAQKDGLF
jgi:flagellar protein FlaI